MIKTITLSPGITLRCFPDQRFKQNCLSIQFVRPMCRQEAAMNALLPAVLLRGTESAPDLRAITLRLDDLYGASVSSLVRRVGDYQTTGFYCSFICDDFALESDAVLKPTVAFLRELLQMPVLDRGAFRKDYVESEKKNLIATIEAQKNDKRAYCAARLLEKMCGDDPYGLPRLGRVEEVRAITPQSLYDHYRKVLSASRVDICYVGQGDPETVAALVRELIPTPQECYVNLPPQTPFRTAGGGSFVQTMDIAQGKLAMGFVTPVTLRDPDFAAMQVCNMVFGGGMTSKLFMNVREKMSLCYDIGSVYHGSKGIVTVNAGIDFDREQTVREEILEQLEQVRRGNVSDLELSAAKEALCSGLRSTHDAPGSIESYYASAALSGLALTPAQYMDAVQKVTVADVRRVAAHIQPDTVYFLKGV